MRGYNFTERTRKVLAMAREEAARLHHEYVGTEHILLGLIREGEGVAATVLQNLSVDLDGLQQTLESTVKKGDPAVHLALALLQNGEGMANAALDRLALNFEAATLSLNDLATIGHGRRLTDDSDEPRSSRHRHVLGNGVGATRIRR